MIIHDFKTLLSKVKVGDEVIVHYAHKFKWGRWDSYSKTSYIVDNVWDNIIMYINNIHVF